MQAGCGNYIKNIQGVAAPSISPGPSNQITSKKPICQVPGDPEDTWTRHTTWEDLFINFCKCRISHNNNNLACG